MDHPPGGKSALIRQITACSSLFQQDVYLRHRLCNCSFVFTRDFQSCHDPLDGLCHSSYAVLGPNCTIPYVKILWYHTIRTQNRLNPYGLCSKSLAASLYKRYPNTPFFVAYFICKVLIFHVLPLVGLSHLSSQGGRSRRLAEGSYGILEYRNTDLDSYENVTICWFMAVKFSPIVNTCSREEDLYRAFPA